MEGLEQLGEQDQLSAEQGLVPVMGKGSRIFYKHLDGLSSLDMHLRTAAEQVELAWLKDRVERSQRGEDSPTLPYHLR